MPLFGLTGNRRELQPRRHHAFQILIIIFSILVPPLAVFIRFGIGKDFFVNVILSICGWIPGHVHNFVIQRVRRNDLRKRNPIWVERYKLTDPGRREALESNRLWAQRYTGYSRPVQYDEDGNEIIADEDDEHGFSYQPGIAAQQRLIRQQTGQAPPAPQSEFLDPEEYYNTDYVPAEPAAPRADADFQETPARPNRSLKSRTFKMLGMRGSAGPSSSAHTPAAQSVSTAGMDDLDRELMGLSTQDEHVPPTQPPPRAPRARGLIDEQLLEVQATGPGVDSIDRELMGYDGPAPAAPAPYVPERRPTARARDEIPSLDRDILDTDHTF